jgi:hypothetical protein
MDPEWARSLRDACAVSGTAFFMKQMAGKAPIPPDLLVQQYPVGDISQPAAYQVMTEAYAHAAGGIGMAKTRQVMYAARPLILSLTGRARLDDQYFTQTLLPDISTSIRARWQTGTLFMTIAAISPSPHGRGDQSRQTGGARVSCPLSRAVESSTRRSFRRSSRPQGRRGAMAPHCSLKKKDSFRSLSAPTLPNASISR